MHQACFKHDLVLYAESAATGRSFLLRLTACAKPLQQLQFAGHACGLWWPMWTLEHHAAFTKAQDCCTGGDTRKSAWKGKHVTLLVHLQFKLVSSIIFSSDLK